MKLVIDIPQEVKEAFDKANKDDINFCFYDYNSVIGKAIKYGTPLDDIKEQQYNKGFYDGYKKATTQANTVIDDIKAEILEETECHYGDKCLGANCPSNTDCMIMGEHAIWIIDKHIGKRRE